MHKLTSSKKITKAFNYEIQMCFIPYTVLDKRLETLQFLDVFDEVASAH